MLDLETRTAVLRLKAEGHGVRTIAKAVGISRNSVRRVLSSGHAEVPKVERSGLCDEHLEEIRALYVDCKGNMVRVWEKLNEGPVEIAYSTLTGFCRRHGIGVEPKKPAGRYHFKPGKEMQHDTSPHDVVVGGKKQRLQCASVVLCYSRMMFIQIYLRFTRFWCKVFLDEAVKYFGGAAGRCMVDNTNVVVASGTGKDAVIAPEMEAFGERYGFKFAAHERGDANRSARVERSFWFIERNFYPGREFADLRDLNRQAVTWCDKVNQRLMRNIRAVPTELYQAELPHMKPLPLYVPEVYELEQRKVDLEGYIHLHGKRYSAPAKLIDRRVEVRANKDRVRIFDGHKLMAEHERLIEGGQPRSTLPEHQKRGLWRVGNKMPRQELPEEGALRSAGGPVSRLAERLRHNGAKYPSKAIRRLHRMYIEYPTDAMQMAVAEALNYEMEDLRRIERMVLQRVAGEFFRTHEPEKGDGHE